MGKNILVGRAAADPEETPLSWRKALQRAYEFGKNIYGTCDGQ